MRDLHFAISQFLYREARLLDDRQWDDWLNCYHPQVVYWMPCWRDDDTLTTDPQRELSLIYYASRDGLEDRIYRIKTERSAASTPEPRTTHQITNIELLGEEQGQIRVRYNWCTLSQRYNQSASYFGHSECLLQPLGDSFQIMRKTIQLNNDYINQVIDIYHI
ncbi:benzoate 1,2-dioxygenase small subunit [Salmonella enterica subsp. enterica serovar Choleraesuis]|nr:benzoate 1,2-dioxygenase small subunit [Salmonella enterica subsp. enterica serovar Choleraesuis]